MLFVVLFSIQRFQQLRSPQVLYFCQSDQQPAMALLMGGRASFPCFLTKQGNAGAHCAVRPRRRVHARSGPTKPQWVRCALHEPVFAANPLQPSCTTSLRRCRVYEEDAEHDPEIAALLQGTHGDPDLIRKRVGACSAVRELTPSLLPSPENRYRVVDRRGHAGQAPADYVWARHGRRPAATDASEVPPGGPLQPVGM